MSNELTAFGRGQISSLFAGDKVQDDLSAGIAASFAVMGYKGKVWSVKYRGDEKQLLRDDGDGARNSIEVVIVASSRHLSKIYYASGYVEGSSAAPDCFSNNSVTPDPSSVHLQNPTCASCERNKWGGKISELTGKPAKECQDNKRLAIVPLLDIPNEIYGGPMLLRVPAASLQEIAQFDNKMRQLGYPHYAYGTRISFDTSLAYPKFQFSPIRPLTDAEAKKVIELRGHPLTARVLSETSGVVTSAGNNVVDAASVFEQPPKPEVKPETKKEEPQSAQPQKSSPLTGVASTTPARPVVQTGALEGATAKTIAPVSESPSSTQAQQPHGGSAIIADTEQTQNIGSTAPEPTQGFEQKLDDLMAGLLPAA